MCWLYYGIPHKQDNNMPFVVQSRDFPSPRLILQQRGRTVGAGVKTRLIAVCNEYCTFKSIPRGEAGQSDRVTCRGRSHTWRKSCRSTWASNSLRSQHRNIRLWSIINLLKKFSTYFSIIVVASFGVLGTYHTASCTINVNVVLQNFLEINNIVY